MVQLIFKYKIHLPLPHSQIGKYFHCIHCNPHPSYAVFVIYDHNNDKYPIIQSIASLNNNCLLLMCVESAATRPSGSANLGWVCTQDGWLAGCWVRRLCPTWSHPPAGWPWQVLVRMEEVQEQQQRLKRILEALTWKLTIPEIIGYSANLQSQPRVKRSQNKLHLFIEKKSKDTRQREQMQRGKCIGAWIHSSYLVCLFCTPNSPYEECLCISFHYLCLQNNHSHCKQLKL